MSFITAALAVTSVTEGMMVPLPEMRNMPRPYTTSPVPVAAVTMLAALCAVADKAPAGAAAAVGVLLSTPRLY